MVDQKARFTWNCHTKRPHTAFKSIKSELVLNFMTYKKGLLSFRGKGHRYVSYKPIDFIIVQLIRKLFWVTVIVHIVKIYKS